MGSATTRLPAVLLTSQDFAERDPVWRIRYKLEVILNVSFRHIGVRLHQVTTGGGVGSARDYCTGLVAAYLGNLSCYITEACLSRDA
jgi:hypothetical protein